MAVTNIKKLVYPYNDGADQAVVDFANIPTLDGDNTFTGSNTFTNIVKVDSGDSWATINDNDFITKAEVNLELNQIKQDITSIEQGGVAAATTEKAGIVELATEDEITNGTANKVVTADGLKEVTDAINTAITNITNGTTAIDLPEATTEVKGIIEIATDTEATTGTATNLAVTPKQLKDAMDSVTVADASETQKGVVQIATSEEVEAGTATNKVMTVAQVKSMITTLLSTYDPHIVVASEAEIPSGQDGVYMVEGEEITP